MKLILHSLQKHLGIFLLSTFFLTLEAVADLLQPALMSYIIDVGVASGSNTQIFYYGTLMLLIALAGAFSAVMRNLFSSRTSQRVGKELRRDLYRHVQSLSLENIDRLQPAALITRITNDVTQIQDFINSSMRMMVKAPITCVGAVVLILLQTPEQSPVIIGILVVVGLLIFGNMRLGYPRFGKVQQALDRLNNAAREFLSSIRVVKAFCGENQETETFGAASAGLRSASVSAMRAMAVFSPLITLTVNTGIVALLWLSQRQDSGQIGRVMASVNYMTQASFALGMISNTLNTAVRALASSARIREVLEEEPAQRKPTAPLSSAQDGGIEFQDVSFAYAGAAQNALDHLSFRIRPGETVGVVGPTGAGKTTLIQLIPRLYDATHGRVSVGGADVREMDEKELRRFVAVAEQKAMLFSGDILENLRWGQPTATEEEARQAAKIACADSFISRTPQGYHTALGQGGVNLSGGQKQRLSLARALLVKPRILILDDCTSALDAETEAAVLNGLRTSLQGVTVLLISQKISAVRRADRILCLENGRLRGYDTHEALLRDCPAYQALYQSQIGGD